MFSHRLICTPRPSLCAARQLRYRRNWYDALQPTPLLHELSRPRVYRRTRDVLPARSLDRPFYRGVAVQAHALEDVRADSALYQAGRRSRASLWVVYCLGNNSRTRARPRCAGIRLCMGSRRKRYVHAQRHARPGALYVPARQANVPDGRHHHHRACCFWHGHCIFPGNSAGCHPHHGDRSIR